MAKAVEPNAFGSDSTRSKSGREQLPIAHVMGIVRGVVTQNPVEQPLRKPI